MSDEKAEPEVNVRNGERSEKLLIEQYKLLAASADQVSTRRLAANSFNTAIHAALIALYGVLSKSGSGWEFVLGLLGIAVCVNWYVYARSSSTLNSVKFQLLQEMEEELPVKIFKQEWERLKQAGYTRFTVLEMRMPLVMGALYVALMIWSAGHIFLKYVSIARVSGLP